MGKTVHTFDGVFDSEREKERFYVECMLRCLSEGGSIDVMGCVNVCHMLSYCQASLEDYAIKNDLPRSAVRVDEDFHYMRGSAVRMITFNIQIQWHGPVNPYSCAETTSIPSP